MILNQEHLEVAISELEKGYVTSMIELIKIPVFNKAIQKDIDDKETPKEKVKQLKDHLVTNGINEKGHNESLENVEAILTEVYKLRTK